MANIVFNSSFETFRTYLKTATDALFTWDFETQIKGFFNALEADAIYPTALGSTLIELTDGAGTVLRFEGSGFGPIIVDTDLNNALTNLENALAAFNGDANGTLSRVILTSGGVEVFRMTVSASSWVIQSGTETLTITGSLPTSVGEINAAYAQLIDPATGELRADFSAAGSFLANYRVDSVVAMSDGQVRASLAYSATGMTLTYGGYTFTAAGAFPANMAEMAAVLAAAQNGMASAATIASASLVNTATGATVAQLTGPVDLTSPFGTEGADTLTLNGVGVGAGMDFSLGGGDDVAYVKVDLPYTWNPNTQDAPVYVDGGAGVDTINYMGSTAGLFIDIWPDGFFNISRSGSYVTFPGGFNVENFTGTSYSDVISAHSRYDGSLLARSSVSHVFRGEAGSDTLRGSLAADKLYGGADHDWLQGSLGDDLVDGGDGAYDWADYYDAPGPVIVTLTNAVNGHTGGASSGADGVDTLVDIERIRGGAYADRLSGNSGDNNLRGGRGDDILDGGAGLDRASYWDATGAVTVTLTDAVNGHTGGSSSGADGVDTLIDIEGVAASMYADTLTGNAGDNRLEGQRGNDVIDGRGGVDTAEYWDATASVTVTLTDAVNGHTGGSSSGADGVDTLIDIENLVGSNSNDVLTGNSLANVLSGEWGDDTLSGGGGADTLNGGAGADKLTGGAGDDTLNGGADRDGALYTEATRGVSVSLAIAGPQNTIGAGVDTLIDIESLAGSMFADVLTGNGGDNTLFGDAGDDLLRGGAGNDWLIGYAGTDTTAYDTATSAVVVDLSLTTAQNTKGAGTDTLTTIENLLGSAYADSLKGDAGANRLDGGAGNDVIAGGAGADTLIGQDGNDKLYGEDGDDLIQGGLGDDYLVGNLGKDRIEGGVGADKLYGREDDDVLLGDEGNDYMLGAEGVDVLYGGAGHDLLDGGIGNDTLYGQGGVDRLYGLDGDDILWGGTGDDKLSGNLGNDTLYGEAGNDQMFGYEGADTMSGGADNDYMKGGDGNDRLDGGVGFDSLFGEAGIDTFVFAPGWRHDRIMDWVEGETMDLAGLALKTGGLTDAQAFARLTVVQSGADTVVSVTGQTANSITLLGVAAGSIDVADFRF